MEFFRQVLVACKMVLVEAYGDYCKRRYWALGKNEVHAVSNCFHPGLHSASAGDYQIVEEVVSVARSHIHGDNPARAIHLPRRMILAYLLIGCKSRD
jgi:hypothetical protein